MITLPHVLERSFLVSCPRESEAPAFPPPADQPPTLPFQPFAPVPRQRSTYRPELGGEIGLCELSLDLYPSLDRPKSARSSSAALSFSLTCVPDPWIRACLGGHDASATPAFVLPVDKVPSIFFTHVA